MSQSSGERHVSWDENVQEGREQTEACIARGNITVLFGFVVESRMYYCCICCRYLNEICGDYRNAYEVMETGDEIMRLFMLPLSLL